MGQNQPQQRSPNALQVADASNPTIRQLSQQKVFDLLDNYLEGSELTGQRIVLDLMTMCTTRPELLKCTPQSLFRCLVFAAQHKRTFGPYGVWPVPRGQEAIPQLAYQSKNTSAREKGALDIYSEVVLDGEPFKVHRENGIIVSIDHEIDYTKRAKPDPKNVVAAWGVMPLRDGRRFYRVLAKHEIDRAHQAAASKSGPWATDYEAMVKKTVEHRMGEDFVGDFTQAGGGSYASMPQGEPEQAKMPGPDLASELFSRMEHAEPNAYERALMMVQTAQTVEQVDGLKSLPEWPGLWRDCTPEERQAIADEAKARKVALQEEAKQEQQEGQGGGDTGEAATSPGGSPDTPPPSSDEQQEQESSGGGAPEATSEAGANEEAASTPPENAGEGAPETAAEDTGPEPDDDELADSPPVFPDLPEKVAKALKDDKHNALKAVDAEIRGAWAKLGQEPGAVVDLIRKRQAEWGKSLSQAEMTLYSAFKKAALDALKAAGLPSEV